MEKKMGNKILIAAICIALIASTGMAMALTARERTVNVTASAAIPLLYLGDTGVKSIPCTVTDLIDQDVGICDGRFTEEECWEGTSLIGTFTIEEDFKGEKELSLWNDSYDGVISAVMTANPKTVDIQLTRYPIIPQIACISATSDIPLWYWDENGIQKIPCTSPNPVQWGMGFGIAVGQAGDYTTIVTPHVDYGGLKVIHFNQTLNDTNTPEELWELWGNYEGDVIVIGELGIIHVVMDQKI